MEIVKNVKRTWHMPYHWCYGKHNTEFFERLKNEMVVYGSRCTSCHKVVVPIAGLCAAVLPIPSRMRCRSRMKECSIPLPSFTCLTRASRLRRRTLTA